MSVTPRITYKNIPPSAALSVAITDNAERLAEMCERISHLRVSVEAVNPGHRKGVQYHVHIELGIPGKALFVSRDADENRANEDAYMAVREAFRAMKRQLAEHLNVRHKFERGRKDQRWEGIDPHLLRGS